MTDPGSEEQTSRLHSALVVEELVAANNESRKTMLALVQSVRQETAARDRKVDALEKSQRQARSLQIIGVIALAGLLILAIVNFVNISSTRAAAHKQTAIAEQVRKTNDTLLDCLNATGQCGRVNAANQIQVLDEVKKYELTGFYCIRNNPADKDPNGEAFLKCVNKLYPGGPQLNGR